MLNRNTVLVLVCIAILALFIAACSSGGSATSVNNITVVNFESNDSACTPKNIETQQGFLMKITLKNSGTTEAILRVPDVPFTLTAPAGQTVLGNFTAPTATGKYNFTCGSASNPTKGEIQVKNN
jgi:hypothetical protein